MNPKSLDDLLKPEIIEQLQDLGVEVNPHAKREELLNTLKAKISSTPNLGSANTATISLSSEQPAAKPMTDMQRILGAVEGLANQVEFLNKRVGRFEDGGKNEFKNDVKSEDVAAADATKEKVDPKITKIVEDTLGIDFGVLIEGYTDRPGFMLTLLVPERLSPVPKGTRPVIDPATGTYKVDEKTGLNVEESYWPGDRRSRALGSSASYDVIQEHCNRVRANIVAFYQKLNRPLPEFRVK